VIRRREERQSWDTIGEVYGMSRRRISGWARKQADFPDELFRNMRPEHSVTSEEMQEMVDQGMTDMQIGQRLGIEKLDTVGKLRMRRGVYRKSDEDRAKSRNSIPEEELARAASLFEEGYPKKAVSEITGISWNALDNHFPDAGLSREEMREMASMTRALNRIAV